MADTIIPERLVLRVSGQDLKAGNTNLLEGVRAAARGGKVVIAERVIASETAKSLRKESIEFARDKAPVRRTKYSRGCADLLHYDEKRFQWRQRLQELRAGVKPRYRRIVSHKFLPWNRHGDALTTASSAMIGLRNALYQVEPDFTLAADGEFFTVIQVQRYDRGGGFLGEHSDAAFHLRQGLETHFELILLLSKKHADYDVGGLFVRIGRQRYSVDEVTEPGDVVIYDVKHPHGCAPVDPGQAPDPTGWGGRWVMLTPPYSAKKFLTGADAS